MAAFPGLVHVSFHWAIRKRIDDNDADRPAGFVVIVNGDLSQDRTGDRL